MQIACLKCKKVYQVDSSKIPPGVTGTRCKACGNSIPLRQKKFQLPPSHSSSAQPPPATEMMQIRCQYCSKKYRINPKALPEGVKSIRCKACDHTIALKPKSASPAKSVQPNTGITEINCLFCGKKYSIHAAKIPQGMTTINCKACGRPVSLTTAQSGIPASENESDKNVIPLQKQKDQKHTSPIPADPTPARDAGDPATPVWKKPRMLAAAAGILIVVLGVYFSVSHWPRLSENRFGLGEIIGKKPAIQETLTGPGPGAAAKTAEPFLALKLNVPLLIEAVDRNLPKEKKNIKYRMVTRILQSFGLSRVELYLYPDPENSFLPVLLAESEEGNSLEERLISRTNFDQFLEPLSNGAFRIKKKSIPQGKQNPFPIDRYRLQFVDHTAIFAPENLSPLSINGSDPMRETGVAQLIRSISGPRDLAVLSIRIPENFSDDWQKKIQGNPAIRQNPQAAMVGGVLAQLTESLKDVESLAIGFRLDEADGRVLRYAQQFRKGVDSNRIYQQLKSKNPDDRDVDGTVFKLIELCNDPRYRHQIGHENNRLTLELNWEKQHDQAFLNTLSQATLGRLPARRQISNKFFKKSDPRPII